MTNRRLPFETILTSAILVLSGCTQVREAASNATQASDSESMMWLTPASKVLRAESFEESGLSKSEKRHLEHKYGRYYGTFEGFSIFAKSRPAHDTRDLIGVVISKHPVKSLTITGELEGGMLYRFKIRQENPSFPFTEMKFRIGFGSAKDTGEPEIRIIKIDKDFSDLRIDTSLPRARVAGILPA